MGRRRSFFVPQTPRITKNAAQFTTTTPAGDVTLEQAVMVGIDDHGDRSTQIQAGCTLIGAVIKLQANLVQAERVQALMYWRPGSAAIADSIASYFTQNPMTEDNIMVRRGLMSSLVTKVIVAGATSPFNHVFKWKGRKQIHEGDDLIVSMRHNGAAAFDINYQIWLKYMF